MKTFDSVSQDIREHPENHNHADLARLEACCTVNGALDTRLMEMHEGLASPVIGVGSRRCDVQSGPCACGAWH